MKETPKSNIDTEIVLALADFESLGESPMAIAKMHALMSLSAIANRYRQEYMDEETLVAPIIRKKIEFIKGSTKASELKEILQPPKVHYNGNEICAVGPYAIPEEELIMWALISPHTMLIEPAVGRYRKLFREVFPDMAKEFGI